MTARLLPELILCLNCGGRCSAQVHPEGCVGPGDAARCESCLKVFILTDDMELRDVTSDDLEKLPLVWVDSARFYIERAKERGQRDG